MKKLIFILFAALITIGTEAQTIAPENVPTPVIKQFKAMFSIAERITWELDYDNYEAGFTVGKNEFIAVFDKEGKWLATHTFLKPSELPKPVKDAMTKEFGELSAYKVEEAEKVETAEGIQYELEVEKGEIGYDMLFAENGELLKKDEKKKEDKGKKK